MREHPDNLDYQQAFEWSYPVASVAASRDFKVRTPHRAFVIDGVQYTNPTGLATHADNFFTGKVQVDGEDLCTLFNTDADSVPPGVAIPADTFIDGVNVAVPRRNGDAGDTVTLVLVKAGTQTLPVGLLIVRGRYL